MLPLARATHHHDAYGKSQYAPGTVASDVSRLLDPAYASVRPASPAYGSPQARAYVDHAGDLHDPDFKPFPDVFLLSAPARDRRRSSHSRSPHRPAWERGDAARSVSDDEEDGAVHDFWAEVNCAQQASRARALSAFSAGTSGGAPSVLSRPRADSTESWYATSAAAEPVNFRHRPSFEEDVFEADEDEEEDGSVYACPAPPVSSPASAVRELVDDDTVKQLVASTPSCTEALKYQLTALSLTIRLRLFRAKRRWREHRASQSSG